MEDENGDTPVLTAVQAGQIKVVCLLAERGADLNHRNKKGKTAQEILNEMMKSLEPINER